MTDSGFPTPTGRLRLPMYPSSDRRGRYAFGHDVAIVACEPIASAESDANYPVQGRRPVRPSLEGALSTVLVRGESDRADHRWPAAFVAT